MGDDYVILNVYPTTIDGGFNTDLEQMAIFKTVVSFKNVFIT